MESRADLRTDSTLRFRGRDELAQSLEESGYVVDEVRDAPDRSGREFVFVASLGPGDQVSGCPNEFG